MTNKKYFHSGDVSSVRVNLEKIESELGHPVPGYLLSADELSRHLSPTEISRICYNIRQVENSMRYSSKSNRSTSNDTHPTTKLGWVIWIGFLAVLALWVILEDVGIL